MPLPTKARMKNKNVLGSKRQNKTCLEKQTLEECAKQRRPAQAASLNPH